MSIQVFDLAPVTPVMTSQPATTSQQDAQIVEQDQSTPYDPQAPLTLDTNVSEPDNGEPMTSVHRNVSPLSPLPVHFAEPSNVPLLMDTALDPTHQQVEEFKNDMSSSSVVGASKSQTPAGEVNSSMQDTDTNDDVESANNDEALQQQLYASLEAQSHPFEYVSDEPERTNASDVNTFTNTAENEAMTDADGSDAQASKQPTKAAPLPPSITPVDLQSLLANLVPSAAPQTARNATILNGLSDHSHLPADLSLMSPITPTAQALSSIHHPNSLPPPPHLNIRPPGVDVPLSSLTSPKSSLPQPPPSLRHPLPEAPTGSTVSNEEDDDRPFTAEEEKAYEIFTNAERDYVSKGQWDRFPNGSRMFIGNLPTEKVTKRDLFRIFAKHGAIAQISIKQAFGFVQYFEANACSQALLHEQASSVRGRKMHLEISKPQSARARAAEAARANGTRRSRSPDYEPNSPRGRPPPPDGRNRQDHWSPSSGGNMNRDRRVPPDNRNHDHYRPGERRNSSPRGRGRDESYGRRDYYSRSRSPPPVRYRSPTPPRTMGPPDDGLPLPYRPPHEIPEVQVIVFDDLDRQFIRYVEQAFKDRNMRIDVLFLAPRLSLQAVIKRQIFEGVQAVVLLNRQSQHESKISMQVFDRRGATARYDEYEGIEPRIGAELVVRAKQQQQQQPPPVPAIPSPAAQYGAPQYGQAPQQGYTQQATQNLAGATGNPNLASLIGSLDPSTLSQLIGSLQGQNQQQPPTPTYATHHQQQHQQQQQQQPNLSQLLAASGRPQGPPQQQQQPQYGAPQYGQPGQNMGGYGQQPPPPHHQQQQHQQQPQGTSAQLSSILAQLSGPGQWNGGR